MAITVQSKFKGSDASVLFFPLKKQVTQDVNASVDVQKLVSTKKQKEQKTVLQNTKKKSVVKKELNTKKIKKQQTKQKIEVAKAKKAKSVQKNSKTVSNELAVDLST